ncbi:PilZ domain-containing protein [Sediminibacillus albus]|uniref:PilZ domain-containing protein n=1 Tax=Sediminibacillus albus TaxID=407036 RepID=A0A1G8WDZ6_9BACI|nr:PilZ domain-containing protein [Sediminibacillus albus]SDJ75905.1 PilZ domain-containing protein [Sediminibacillus albus]
MYFKRNEPYRYSFSQPVPSRIKKIPSNQDDSFSNAVIVDVSLSGIRMEVENLFLEDGDRLQLEFQLLNQACRAIGSVVWRKGQEKRYSYGIRLDYDEQYQRQITDLLKRLARGGN